MRFRPGCKRALPFSCVLGVLAFVLLAFVPRSAHAYGWMIRHRYTSCISCHADPSGGSLLTAFGRQQSEDVLRTRYGRVDPDKESTLGEFAFGALTMPEGLTAGGDIRAMGMNVKPAGSPATSRLLLMQADAVAQYESGRLRVNASAGYVHEGALGASITHGENDRLVSRHHWLGVTLGEDSEWLVRAGRINLPFGLRIVDHTTYVRRTTATDLNANQDHGVALSRTGEKTRGEIMLIAGNFQISPDDFRRRGYAGFIEYAPRKFVTAGFSSLITHAALDLETKAATFRQAHGPFVRYSPWQPLVISFEADMLVRSPRHQKIEAGFATLAQADFEVVRGVHLGAAFEAKDEALARQNVTFGTWGSVWWFFLPHADVRLDANWQSLATAGSRTQITTILGQVHGFL